MYENTVKTCHLTDELKDKFLTVPLRNYWPKGDTKPEFDEEPTEEELLQQQQSCLLPPLEEVDKTAESINTKETENQVNVISQLKTKFIEKSKEIVDNDESSGIYDMEIRRHSELFKNMINSEDLEHV